MKDKWPVLMTALGFVQRQGELVHRLRMDSTKVTHLPGARNVLVIGETGGGKSTFINMLANYYRNGSLENIKIAIPTKHLSKTESDLDNGSENALKDQMVSKTNKCTVYPLGTNINFIDTPGLNDTRGREQDEANVAQIVKAAEDAGTLCALVVVLNGTNARMTVGMAHVLQTLKGHIPDSVLDNVLVVLTNCQQHTANFDVQTLTVHFPKPTVFFFDNSAFSSDPHKWDHTAQAYLRIDWRMSFKNMQLFEKKLNELNVVSSAAFADMSRLRRKIKEILHDAQLRIANLQRLHDEISLHRARKSELDDSAAQYQNFKTTKQVTKREVVDAPYHSTICSVCDSICHDHCGLSELPTAGETKFKMCWIMQDGFCTQCTKKCSHESHYHARRTVQETTQTVEEELTDVKNLYTEAISQARNNNSLLSQKEHDIAEIEKSMTFLVQEVEVACRELRKLCSGFNLVNELHLTLKKMEMEAVHLVSLDARDAAEKAISQVRAMVDRLCAIPEIRDQKDRVFTNAYVQEICAELSPEDEEFLRSRPSSYLPVDSPSAHKTGHALLKNSAEHYSGIKAGMGSFNEPVKVATGSSVPSSYSYSQQG